MIEQKFETKIVTLPFMYKAVDANIDTAVKLISGNDPEIFILTSDCVEVSLRLLADKKAQFFDAERVDRFLQSSSSNANKREDKPAKKFNHTLAKSIHKEYFHDDWKLYNASLFQMKNVLIGSNLNASDADYKECMRKIDDKLAYMKG
eukprot:9494731-Ditylum_brightwellii.AAC.1